MDYIPLLEAASVIVACFVVAGTIVGLRVGEVHFPIQWLNEAGYKRDDPKFKKVVFLNLAMAAGLFGISAVRLIALAA
jgi:hypothetical protein